MYAFFVSIIIHRPGIDIFLYLIKKKRNGKPLPITDPRALKTQSGSSFAEVELPVEQDKNMSRNPISEVTPCLPVFVEKSTSTYTHREPGAD